MPFVHPNTVDFGVALVKNGVRIGLDFVHDLCSCIDKPLLVVFTGTDPVGLQLFHIRQGRDKVPCKIPYHT